MHGHVVMSKFSYIDIAKNYFQKFEQLDTDLHFSILRQVIVDLEEVSRCDSSESPELVASGCLIQNLFNQILEDLTFTTPWDDKGSLKKTREAALLLARNALQCLAEYNPMTAQHGDLLQILNEAKNKYYRLLDTLNSEDRLIILKTEEE